MLKINIRPKIIEKTKKKKVSVLVVLFCLLLLIVTFAISGFLYVTNADLAQKTKTVENNIESQKSSNNSLLELDKKAKELDKTINDIKTLSEQSISFSAMLKEVAARTPRDLQIKDLTCDTAPGKEKVEISGQAASRRSIMQFRKELEKSYLFSSVDFESSSQADSSNFDFKMSMNIKKSNQK